MERNNGAFTSDLYHLTASGHASWYGFTKEIVKLATDSLNLPLTLREINAIPTSAYPTPAKRPMNSQLALNKLETAYALKMPEWQSVLKLCMQEVSGS